MPTIDITASVGSGNETTFNVVDSNNDPVDLTALGATVVTVTVCGKLTPCGAVTIDSSNTDVVFSGSVLTVKFGQLALKPIQPVYFPKISYITAADPDPEVIAGEGYTTVIKLRAIC